MQQQKKTGTCTTVKCRNVKCDLRYDTKSSLRSREREIGRGSCRHGVFVVTVQTSKELEPKYTPQVFLGLLVGKSRSAIGQFFPCH